MRSKKKPGIQLKIFLPVFMILIIFPIAVFLMFGVAANGYFKQMAERNTDRLVIQTRRVIREAYGDADRNEAKNDTETGKSKNKEQEQEKEMSSEQIDRAFEKTDNIAADEIDSFDGDINDFLQE